MARENTDGAPAHEWAEPEQTHGDEGMATVEYAMVTVAAAAFAGVLAVLIRSNEVRELLAGVIQGAFGG